MNPKTTRRNFIKESTAGIVGASLLTPFLTNCAGEQKSVNMNTIGFQSWAIKEMLAKDFSGTLKMMADMGYQSMELCSPPGYTQYGFGFLEKFKASELKKMIADAGMSCVSCHYGFRELKENGQARMDFAKELGLTQMVVASFGLPENPTLADWRKAASELNPLGELAKKNGLTLAFHNHNTEFETLEGELIYDAILQQMDPALVKLQFQVWVIIAGYKAADYFRKHPGRFVSAHLYDWSGTAEEMVPVGKGKVDYKELFEAAKIGGVQNTFVEMDFSLMKESAEYLKTLA
jgi:sugar phosphate isomerase/epimerase